MASGEDRDVQDRQADEKFLRRALELAENGAGRGDGGPFGAIVVKGGQIIAEGWNTVVADNDPTAHAEVNAIRLACRALNVFHLRGCTLYASSEPCPLCLSAAYWAKIGRMVFANGRGDAARIGFPDEELYAELARPTPKRQIPAQQVQIDGSAEIMDRWAQGGGKVMY